MFIVFALSVEIVGWFCFSFGLWLLSGIVVDAAGNLFFSDERPQNVLMVPHHWVNGSNVEEKTSKKEKKERKEREEEERFIHSVIQFGIQLWCAYNRFVSHKNSGRCLEHEASQILI